MIEITVPGDKNIRIKHLVLDHNGTLAVDGILIEGVRDCLKDLSRSLNIHVVTADTFGRASDQLAAVSCELTVLSASSQNQAKCEFVKRLSSNHTVCIGNGRNDELMLKEAALGIAVILEEGAAVETIVAADVVCTSIIAALELLKNPLRLTATLRI